MKKNKILIITAVILIVGAIGIFLYPTVSQLINNQYAKGTVEQYNRQVTTLSVMEKEKMLSEARQYNLNLSNNVSDSFSPDAFNVDPQYKDIMNITEDGQMGSVSIPSIGCELPIYHGTSEDILDKGAVHMASTSFPIGGESTHAVISAHTAYPGKEFFNKLTDVEIGDEFTISILGDALTYRVVDINIILPDDTSLLRIVDGKDLVTLVTCTPYSVNTHRLLVRGERVLKEKEISTPSELTSTKMPLITSTSICSLLIPISVIVLGGIFLLLCFNKKGRDKNDSAS